MRTNLSRVARFLCGGLAGGFVGGAARSQTFVNWADVGADFATGANWAGGTAPTSTGSTVAVFAAAAPNFQPNLTGGLAVDGVRFAAGAGAYTLAGSGSLSVGSYGIDNQSSAAQTISVPLSFGATSATVVNAGTLTIAGSISNQTSSGLTVTNNGTMTVSGDVDNAGGLVFNGAGGNGLVSGIIRGVGSVGISGTGVWVLSGANAYSGGTTITGGTLSIAADRALGDTAGSHPSGTGRVLAVGTSGGASQTLGKASFVTTTGSLALGGGTLQTTATFTLDASRAVTLDTGGGVFNTDANTTLTYGGIITGTGSLTKAGGGTLALTANNTYTGATAINAGTLTVASDAGLGDAAGALSFGGGTLKLDGVTGAFSSSRAVNLNAGGGTINLNTFEATLGGVITGSGGLTVQGTGILTLGGASNFTGGLTVQGGGVLSFAADNNLGDTTSGVTLNGGYLRTQAAIANFTHAIALGGLGGNFNTNGSNSTVSGVISGSGAFSVQSSSGAGTLTLTAGNTYAGGTFVDSGTLTLAHTGGLTLASGGDVTLSNSAILQVDTNQTIRGLISSSATTRLQLANGTTFTANLPTNQVSTFAGTIRPASSGSATFVKDGPGTMILTGTANPAYPAATLSVNVNSGTLQLGNGGTTGDVAGNLAISSPGTVDFNRSDGNGVVFPFAISGSGLFVKDGATNLTLTGDGTAFAGTAQINAGTLTLGADNAWSSTAKVSIGAAGTLAVGSGVTTGSAVGSLTGSGFATIAAGKSLTIAETGVAGYGGVISGGGSLVKSTSVGSLTLSGNNTYSGPSTFNGTVSLTGENTGTGTLTNNGTLNIGNGGTSGSVAANIVDNGFVSFSRSNATSYNGMISGTGTVTKSGAGTLTLGGANTYSGNTFANGGVLADGVAGAFSPGSAISFGPGGGLAVNFNETVLELIDGAANGTIALNAGAALTFGDGNSNLFAGVISGAGSLIKQGAGNATLAGANTYSGGTKVSAGTLTATNATGSATGTGTVKVMSGATLAIGNFSTNGAIGGDIVDDGTVSFNRSDAFTYGGAISGAGVLNKVNSGTLILTADQPLFSGTINVTGGTLQLGNGGTGGGLVANVILGNGAILAFNRSDPAPIAYNGVVSGTGSFVKSGSAALVLGGANIFSGGVTINGGTLTVGVTNAVPGVVVTVNSGATFDVAQSAAVSALNGPGAASVAAGKTLTLKNSGPLSVVVSGAGGVAFDNGGQGNGVSTVSADETYTGLTTVNNGTLNLGAGGPNGTTGSVAGDIALANNSTTINFNRDASNYGYAGAISGSGALRKSGSGTLTLTGKNSYTGSTGVNGGTLKIGAVNTLPTGTSLSLLSGTKLDVSASQTIASFLNSFGSSIEIATGQILDVTLGSLTFGTAYTGVISGAGSLEIGPSTDPQGGHTLTLTGDNTYTGGTTIDTGGALRIGNGTNQTGSIVGDVLNNGVLIFQTVNSTNFTGKISGSGSLSQGTATSNAGGGELRLSSANDYTGGTDIYRGGLFAVNTAGSATGAGHVTVHGGVLAGTGTIAGSVDVLSGAKIAPAADLGVPGTLTVGDTMLAGGSTFVFQINDANGVAGQNLSLLNIVGVLNVTATSADPFSLALYSIDSAKAQGLLANFDPAQAYRWQFLTASGGIAGFDSSVVKIDTSSFQNSFSGGFSVAQAGNNLFLDYSPTAVPEPSTWALLAMGAGLLWIAGQRRRKVRGA